MIIKILNKINISCDFLLIVVVNIVFIFGVNGKVVTRTIVPLSPQYLTPVRANNHVISESSNRPDLAKTILMKQLLELDCLRENYNKYRLKKQYLPLKNQQFQPPEKPFSTIKGNNINNLELKAQRDNFLENRRTKNRRFNGEDNVIIFTPLGQRGWEYPIYIPKSAPGRNVNQFVNHRNQSQLVNFDIKGNRTLQVKNHNISMYALTTENSKNATQEEKSTGIAEINLPQLQNSENKPNDGSNRETGKVANPSYFPVTFKWPIRKPVPNDYKFSKFSEFPQKLHKILAKNASGPSRWLPARPQSVQPYEVKEITEGNVQFDMTKEDDPSVNRRKPHTGGNDRITSQISSKAQTNSKTDPTTDLLQNSISKILQSLMGLNQHKTQVKLRSQTIKDGFTVKPESIGKEPSTKIPSQFPIKNLPQKKKLWTNPAGTEKHTPSSSTQINTNSFMAENNIPDYQKFLPNLMTEYLNNQDAKTKSLSVTSFVPSEPFTPKAMNNPTLTTKGIGRDLKLPNNPPSLLDLFSYSAHQKSNVPPQEDNHILTSPGHIKSNYYEHTEVTLPSFPYESSPHETITVLDPVVWLSTDQALRGSPETSTTESGSALQETSTTFDLNDLFEVMTTAFTHAHSYSTAIPKTTENEEDRTTNTEIQFNQRTDDGPTEAATQYQTKVSQIQDDQTTTTTTEILEKQTTPNYKEPNNDPLTIDLFSTTVKFDSKNMDSLLKSGRKLNFDTNPEVELTNFLSNTTEQRRSDILINDVLDEYEKFKNDVPSEYLNKLKKNLSISDIMIDDIISIIPSVVDDLRQNKLPHQDLSILSQAFGKYWPDILALSKDTKIDMLPLLQMEKEDDLKNFIENFLGAENRETMTTNNSVESSPEKSTDSPTYDYMDEYKDIYDDMIGQSLTGEKRKRLRAKRESNHL